MGVRKDSMVVGSVVILSFVILIGGVLYLKESRPGERPVSYYAMFDQVSTLTEGDPVKVNGVKMGKVSQIRLDDHRVRVEMRIHSEVKIPVDSRVRVQNIGLMGERQIGIVLGDAERVYDAGATFEGEFDAGIAEAMGIAGEVFEETKHLVSTARKAVDSTLARPEFVDAINRIVAEAEEVSKRLESMMQKAQPQAMRTLDHLEQASVEVKELVSSQKKPIQEMIQSGQEISDKVLSVTHRADKVALQLEGLLEEMQSTEGTFGALLHDSAFHLELRETIREANALFQQVREKGLDVNVDLF